MAIEQAVNDPRSERERQIQSYAGLEEAYPLGVAISQLGLTGNLSQAANEAMRTLHVGLSNALGRDPSPAEFKQYLQKNLDLNLAKDLVSGRVDQGIATELASKYAQNSNLLPRTDTVQQIDPNAQAAAFEATAREQAKQQQDYLDQLQTQQEANATQTLKGQYGEEAARIAKEAAQIGRLTQPAQQENVNRLSDRFMQSLGQTVGQIRSAGLNAKAQGQTDLLGRLQNQNQFGVTTGQNQNQFQHNLALQKQLGLGGQSLQNKTLLEQIRQYDVGRTDLEKDRTLAERLGRQRADANKPGILDYLNTGANIVGNVGKFLV